MLDSEQIQALQPKSSPYKVTDGGGLHLLVMPNGSKYWRFRYRLHGKYKTLALGVYPKITLYTARNGRDFARQILAAGGDPMAVKRKEVKEREELAKTPPAFHLAITHGALTIKTIAGELTLTPQQTEAIRAFLIATPNEVML